MTYNQLWSELRKVSNRIHESFRAKIRGSKIEHLQRVATIFDNSATLERLKQRNLFFEPVFLIMVGFEGCRLAIQFTFWTAQGLLS